MIIGNKDQSQFNISKRETIKVVFSGHPLKGFDENNGNKKCVTEVYQNQYMKNKKRTFQEHSPQPQTAKAHIKNNNQQNNAKSTKNGMSLEKQTKDKQYYKPPSWLIGRNKHQKINSSKFQEVIQKETKTSDSINQLNNRFRCESLQTISQDQKKEKSRKSLILTPSKRQSIKNEKSNLEIKNVRLEENIKELLMKIQSLEEDKAIMNVRMETFQMEINMLQNKINQSNAFEEGHRNLQIELRTKIKDLQLKLQKSQNRQSKSDMKNSDSGTQFSQPINFDKQIIHRKNQEIERLNQIIRKNRQKLNELNHTLGQQRILHLQSIRCLQHDLQTKSLIAEQTINQLKTIIMQNLGISINGKKPAQQLIKRVTSANLIPKTLNFSK